MKIASLTFLFTLLVVPTLSAKSMHETHLCNGIVEENSEWVGVNSILKSNVSEAAFNAVLDRIESLYTPIFTNRGMSLEITRLWENGTVNAYASQAGTVARVLMFGGLARRPEITPLGFAMVACHEVGHHIGGAPTYPTMLWASNEGQSDYFATLKCMRKFIDGLSSSERSLFKMENVTTSAFATAACSSTFNTELDREICVQSAAAGESLGNLLAFLRQTLAPKHETPDSEVVEETEHGHPMPQCRLDTYLQGALCDGDYTVDDTKQDDSRSGMCNRTDGYVTGVRPMCWYQPI